MALYTTKKFKTIEKYVAGIKSKRDQCYFQGQSASIFQYLADGALAFTFLSEIKQLLSVLVILAGPHAGASVDLIKEGLAKVCLNKKSVLILVDLLDRVTKEQLDKIKDGKLPIIPIHMGIKWHQCSSTEILKQLRSIQSMNLNQIAEMAGFSYENAYLAFGLEDRVLLDEANHKINQLWDAETAALLSGIEAFLESEQPAPKRKSLLVPGMPLAELPLGIKNTQSGINDVGLFAINEKEQVTDKQIQLVHHAVAPL